MALSGALVIAWLCSGSCRSLDRTHPESAMLAVELSFVGDLPASSSVFSWFDRSGVPEGELYIMRVPAGQSRPIAATHSTGNLFLFSNIAPGRYRLFEMVISDSGPYVPDEFGRMRALNSTIVVWRDASAELSVTEALAGVAGYMGSYTIQVRSRNVSAVQGTRDAADEERVLREILKHWDGEWPRQVRLQMAESY